MDEKKNGGKFLKGFLAGIAGTLVVCIVAVSVLSFNGYSLTQQTVTGDRNNTNGALKTGLTADMLKKMTYINSIVDKYYLFDKSEEDVANGIYAGMMAGLGDPYSVYYTEDQYNSLMESSSGVFCGIGVVVQANVTTGIISVVRAMPGTPGEEAGFISGDIIYAVDGTEVTGMDLSNVVALIKGEEGTEVTVTIYRDNEKMDFTLKRAKIEVPTVEYKMMDNNIGYIQVTEFDDITVEQYKTALEDLTNQGMEGLIVDLRDNPGGLLSSVCSMLDEMLPEGLIVYTEDKDGNREEEKSDAEHQFTKPLAVLINGNSASASEIYAGAIKDYGTGTLIGTQSFGKGIVQRIIELGDGSAIKLTISNYFTPKGNNIHKIGITPDIVVEANADTPEDEQLDKAVEVITEKLGK